MPLNRSPESHCTELLREEGVRAREHRNAKILERKVSAWLLWTMAGFAKDQPEGILELVSSNEGLR